MLSLKPTKLTFVLLLLTMVLTAGDERQASSRNHVVTVSYYGSSDFVITPDRVIRIVAGDTITFRTDDPGMLVLQLDDGSVYRSDDGEVTIPAKKLRVDTTVRCSMVLSDGSVLGWEATHESSYGVSVELPIYSPKEPIPQQTKGAGPNPVKRIPKESYKIWSLFLINNPQWVVAQSNDKVKDLYDKFQAFGRAIGPDHVAIWFWSQNIREDSFYYKAVDVIRSEAFCEKLKLAPSRGPYILVTSDYPGRGLISDPSSFLPTPLKSYYTVSLNNKSADEIMTLLTRIADKITADRLADLDSGSKGYWSAWQRIFEAIRDFLHSREMTVNIKTPISDVQIK